MFYDNPVLSRIVKEDVSLKYDSKSLSRKSVKITMCAIPHRETESTGLHFNFQIQNPKYFH
jgi:hypothetical protein